MTASIAWHADSYDHRLASIRYRLLAPLAALQAAGVPIERYDPQRGPTGYGTIIFSKSQSTEALGIARAAKANGCRILYDLCDNLFAAHAVGHASAGRITRLCAMLGLADEAILSTPALLDQITAQLPDLATPCRVIPDVVTLDADLAPTPNWRDRWELGRLNAFLRRNTGALHCVWFGKSLGRVSGYVHLGRAVDMLARFPHPTTLTVISNDRWKYMRAASNWPIPCLYLPWRLSTHAAALAKHRVAVIPVESNDYTTGKTMNRPALALLAGLGVVADPLPSYQELAPFVFLGNWTGGLEAYGQRNERAEAAIRAGQAYLRKNYSAAALAGRWKDALALTSA